MEQEVGGSSPPNCTTRFVPQFEALTDRPGDCPRPAKGPDAKTDATTAKTAVTSQRRHALVSREVALTSAQSGFDLDQIYH